jgi:hypothetical protein
MLRRDPGVCLRVGDAVRRAVRFGGFRTRLAGGWREAVRQERADAEADQHGGDGDEDEREDDACATHRGTFVD